MKRVLNLVAAVTIAGCAGVGWATPFDGVYDPHPGSCNTVSDGRTEIRGNLRLVWEGRCELSNPTTIRDMPNAMLYDETCNVEGSFSYQRTLIFTLNAGHVGHGPGLGILRNGFLSTYYMCPPGTSMY